MHVRVHVRVHVHVHVRTCVRACVCVCVCVCVRAWVRGCVGAWVVVEGGGAVYLVDIFWFVGTLVELVRFASITLQ